MPKILKPDPILHQLRNDIQLPISKPSKIDIADPNRFIPKTLAELPRRIHPRTDILEPICNQSMREMEEPSRVIPNTDIEEPNLNAFLQLKLLPKVK
jgi:hypothetical protein